VVELEALSGRDYVIAYLSMLEYFKPKLGRVEIATQPDNKIISVFGRLVEDQVNTIELS